MGGVLEIQAGAVGWLSGTVSLFIGGFILATFLALFNYLTPSGRVTVTGRVVEVTPNVTGQIVAIPVKPNVPVKVNDVSSQIDLVHHRERGHAGWNVFAERLSDHQGRRGGRYRFR
jgi:multidrug resistance efflux pump